MGVTPMWRGLSSPAPPPPTSRGGGARPPDPLPSFTAAVLKVPAGRPQGGFFALSPCTPTGCRVNRPAVALLFALELVSGVVANGPIGVAPVRMLRSDRRHVGVAEPVGPLSEVATVRRPVFGAVYSRNKMLADTAPKTPSECSTGRTVFYGRSVSAR